jgi:hypothetical protein
MSDGCDVAQAIRVAKLEAEVERLTARLAEMTHHANDLGDQNVTANETNIRLRAVCEMHEKIGDLALTSAKLAEINSIAKWFALVEKKQEEIKGLRAQLADRRTAIEQMLTDTFKETMAIYGAAGGAMGDTLADKMALRLGQFTKDAKKFLKKGVVPPAAPVEGYNKATGAFEFTRPAAPEPQPDELSPSGHLLVKMAEHIASKYKVGDEPVAAPAFRNEGERLEAEMDDPPLDDEKGEPDHTHDVQGFPNLELRHMKDGAHYVARKGEKPAAPAPHPDWVVVPTDNITTVRADDEPVAAPNAPADVISAINASGSTLQGSGQGKAAATVICTDCALLGTCGLDIGDDDSCACYEAKKAEEVCECGHPRSQHGSSGCLEDNTRPGGAFCPCTAFKAKQAGGS